MLLPHELPETLTVTSSPACPFHTTIRPYYAKVIIAVVDVKPTIGEFIGVRVKVEYDFDQLHYVSNVGFGFCQNSRDVKVNDKVEILINPINANDCMLYDPQASLLSLIIGAVMIIVSGV